MSTLSTLKLVSAKQRQSKLSPVMHRRKMLSTKLAEQIELAHAIANGTTYQATRIKRVQDAETGAVKNIEVPKSVKQWWWKQENGKACLAVRYGAKTIELAKGKTACEIASNEESWTRKFAQGIKWNP